MEKRKQGLGRGAAAVRTIVLAAVLLLAVPVGPAAAASATLTVPEIMEKTSPSVVAIIGRPQEQEEYSAFGGLSRFDLAHGTGVIIKSDGWIVTNAHVVQEMKNLIVVTSDGKAYNAKATHLDEDTDLALVKIEAAGLREAEFAEIEDVKAGQSVVAIGTPISFALRNSVTGGMISGMERTISSKYQLIQTDAAINPGNSGGPLVNMNGEVVGINSMKFVEYGVDNLGFAIPVDTVKHVIAQFFENGEVKRPYLGVELEESWEALVGLPTTNPLTVIYVDPDSAAGKAGLKDGDQISAIDGKTVTTLVGYNELLKLYKPGQQVSLTVIKGTEAGTSVTVTLGEEESSSDWEPGEDDGDLDADRGKTKIGDSHFDWSMKYPTGLVKSFQTEEGRRVMFGNTNGEYSIIVNVDENESLNLSPAALLKKLGGESASTVLEKGYVKDAEYPYAKMTIEGEYGGYQEARAFQKGSNVYRVALNVSDPSNVQNKVKFNSYLDVLGSFKPEYDGDSDSVKDISVFKTGNSKYTNAYGLGFELPAEWESDSLEGGSYFTNEDYTQSVSVRVTSLSSGDSLAKWIERDADYLKRTYVESSREIGEAKPFGEGEIGHEVRYASTLGDTWEVLHIFYVVKDRYKYEIAVQFMKDDAKEAEEIVDLLRKTIAIDKDEMNPLVGFIQDDQEWIDPNRYQKVTNEKYGYTVSVPETWENYSDYYSYRDSGSDSDYISYEFVGGTFDVSAEKETLDDILKNRETYHKESAEADMEYKYTVEDAELYGLKGKKISVRYNADTPYELTEYLFEKDKTTYTVSVQVHDAVATDVLKAQVKAVLESFKLTK
ncbi:S1C family serine protease [Paenibacillus turpanensis]|uniref:S1C family serine protease n=1 Tax=Paenibacillus turpanensis TaxID=2689078 RepID=UPI001408D90A|nr:trypsin-like peptidase domain-containing protein [Paenibacillus turpanensis]